MKLSAQEEETFTRSMETFRRQYENGHRESLFQAIRLCGGFEKPMPHWVAVAFAQGWDRYTSAIPGPGDDDGKSTLGGAFGIVRPPNFKPYKHRRDVYASLIWQFVENERKSGTPVDAHLFARAARLAPPDGGADFYKKVYGIELPSKERKRISARTAERLYYKYRQNLSEF